MVTGKMIKIGSSFLISISDYPVSCRVANVRLFGEVLADGVLLVYGRYDLIFCCSYKENQELSYYSTIYPHTMTQTFLPDVTGFKGKERVQIIMIRSTLSGQ